MKSFRILLWMALLMGPSFLWANMPFGVDSLSSCDSLSVSFSYQSTGLSATFTPSITSPVSGGGVDGLVWNFGDGNSSSLNQPTHTYSSPGNYYVCLGVVDSLSDSVVCQDTFCAWIYVAIDSCDSVQAHFSYTLGHLSACFTNHSQSWYNPVYTWDFGDGTTSNEASPNHQYGSAGNYSVCLILSDSLLSDSICKDTFCQTITIVDSCDGYTASFTYTDKSLQVPGLAVFGIPAGIDFDYAIWDFGDGSTLNSSLSPIDHTYTHSGSAFYTVCVTLVDYVYGCDSSITDSCTATFCDKIFVRIGQGTRRLAASQGPDLLVYPSPTADQLFLSYSDRSPVDGTASILDPQGKIWYQEKLSLATIHKLNLKALPAGIYFVRIESEGRPDVQRFIKW